MGSSQKMSEELGQSLKLMNNADTLGSIMKFYLSDATRNTVMVRVQEYEEQLAHGEIVTEENRLLLPYMRIVLALTDKYAAICMNPPYMGSGRFDATLSNYVKNNYPKSKADLFAVFMDVAIDRLADCGKYGMINMHSWMFLSSFEELRKSLLDNEHIDSLLHLGPRTFDELSGEVVQNAAFVVSKSKDYNRGIYFRLVDGKNCGDKESMFLDARNNHTEKIYYQNVRQENFEKIPSCPIGYWISNAMFNVFRFNKLREYGSSSKGIITGDNAKYIRLWYECEFSKINFNAYTPQDTYNNQYIWYPCKKGGTKRKWYGNNLFVINWINNGYSILKLAESEGRNKQDYSDEYKFKPAISWSDICSNGISFRYSKNDLSESAGMSYFPKTIDLFYALGFLNTPIASEIIKIINPTIHCTAGNVESMPLNLHLSQSSVTNIVKANISASKLDWDSHETSWDFETNELVSYVNESRETPLECVFVDKDGQMGSYSSDAKSSYFVESLYQNYVTKWMDYFIDLQNNEEELNRKFIEIYGLQDELTPEVPLDEITILQQGEITIENNDLKWNADVVMKQLISYAVGCMMGRYSIDKPGLILANQGDGLEQYNEQVPNSRFGPDDDGIIPLMSAQSDFADNATIRFKQWLVVAFGEETLVENLNFIEKCLGKSIDDYFVKDFWKDHKKMYQNRPIYWLFSSMKGAFQCLAYMHRMDAYTAERIRTKYLLPHIEWLIQKQSEMEANAANLNARERKELDSIGKQIEECREYHARLHVVADEQIEFNLDDGVVVNYAKFRDVLAKIK